MSDKENIIVRCARMYELKLETQKYDHNEIEKMLNEWIKNALEYSSKHPELTEKELEEYLLQEEVPIMNY